MYITPKGSPPFSLIRPEIQLSVPDTLLGKRHRRDGWDADHTIILSGDSRLRTPHVDDTSAWKRNEILFHPRFNSTTATGRNLPFLAPFPCSLQDTLDQQETVPSLLVPNGRLGIGSLFQVTVVLGEQASNVPASLQVQTPQHCTSCRKLSRCSAAEEQLRPGWLLICLQQKSPQPAEWCFVSHVTQVPVVLHLSWALRCTACTWVLWQ